MLIKYLILGIYIKFLETGLRSSINFSQWEILNQGIKVFELEITAAKCIDSS